MLARAAGLRGGAAAWLATLSLVAGATLPWFIYTGLATEIVLWALFAAAFDLLLGYTGMLSFGHAMFWGGASYVTGILALRYGWSFVPAVLGGMFFALAASAIIGALSIRRQGIYFAMITLAFGQLTYFVANELKEWTGSENGLQGVPRPPLFGLSLEDGRVFYYVTFAAVALAIAFAIRVVNSPFGQVLKAIRENEARAISLGYKAHLYKLKAFVISATLSGLAGSLYVLAHRFTSLDTVDWRTSGEVVIMTVLGGMGTIFGPMFGAALYLIVNDRLSTVTASPNFVMGVIFIFVVSVFRRGIIGELLHALGRKPAAGTDEEAVREVA